MPYVEIRVRGQIDERWSDWFEGLTITHIGQDDAVLAGLVVDQSALYGLLSRLRDLGLPLISVNSVGEGPAREDEGQDTVEGRRQSAL